MASEYGNDYITLTDEDGREIEFEHIGSVEVDGLTYVGLVEVFDDPQKMLESDGQLIILKVVEDESGEEILVTIEDPDELRKAAHAFEEEFDDELEIDE